MQLLKVTDILNPQQEPFPCDPWHYTGDENWHRSDYGKEFIEYCKEKLPQKSLPIKIGCTGYIDLTGPIKTPEYCWDLDQVRRIVIVIDDKLLFQRMLNGHQMMYNKLSEDYKRDSFNNYVTEELIRDLRAKI